MQDAILYLNWPPTINSYYKCAKHGGKVLSRKGRLYREAVAEDVREQTGPILLDEKMLVEVILFPPDRRTRDLDNYMKPLLDALTNAEFWEDDRLIDQLPIYRGESVQNGQVQLRVSPAGPVIPYSDNAIELLG